MNSDAVRAAFAAGGLSRIAPRLESLMRNSVRMTCHSVNEGDIAIGASKLGGMPDLVDDMAWPVMGSVPMSFVVQVNLGEIQSFDVDHVLPTSGLLSCFYDANQQTYGSDPADRAGWAILYSPAAPDTLKRRAFPKDLPMQAQFKACAVSFTAETTLPQRPTVLDSGLDWNDAERKAYSDFMAAFPSAEDRALRHHRLLGHSDDLQDDMHVQAQLLSHGFSDDQSAEAQALISGVNDWQLLLQIDSEPDAGMQWGSTGLLYFWITRQDLQAGRFDRVWGVLQSE